MNGRVLVPFELPDPEPLSSVLAEDISSLNVVFMGHYAVPEQTPSEAARDQFEAEAQATLDELAAPFVEAGASVETHLVFGKDRKEAIDTAANEYEVGAVLTPGVIGERISKVLVPLRGSATMDNIVEFVVTLLQESDTEVTLLHIPEDEEDASVGESLLRGARDRLVDEGFSHDRVKWQQRSAASPAQGIVDAADEYDLLIVGESEPSLRERIVGVVTSQVVSGAACPELIVRN